MFASKRDIQAAAVAMGSVHRAQTDLVISLLRVLIDKQVLTRSEVDWRLLSDLIRTAAERGALAIPGSNEHSESEFLMSSVDRIRKTFEAADHKDE